MPTQIHVKGLPLRGCKVDRMIKEARSASVSWSLPHTVLK